MPSVLFVVHGMGDSLPGWSNDIKTLLDVALRQYSKFESEDAPFRARVEIEEICYDPVFDKLLAEWGRSNQQLKSWVNTNGLSLSGTLNTLAFSQLPKDQEGFLWETLLDPVLYRGSPIIRDKVRDVVIRQLVDRWDHHLSRTTSTDAVKVSILCHSQGTMVMSDVLAIIGEARQPELVPFSASKRSIECLITLANVSRLGPGGLIDIDSRDSCVRPMTAPAWKAGRQNYLKRLINARHTLDPFCFWQRFAPKVSWGERYRSVEIGHVHQANTHGYTHYLSHPLVHIPLFRALLGFDSISETDERNALKTFPDIMPPSCEVAIDNLRERLKALSMLASSEASSLDQWITNGIEFYKAVRSASTECSELVEGLSGD